MSIEGILITYLLVPTTISGTERNIEFCDPKSLLLNEAKPSFTTGSPQTQCCRRF